LDRYKWYCQEADYISTAYPFKRAKDTQKLKAIQYRFLAGKIVAIAKAKHWLIKALSHAERVLTPEGCHLWDPSPLNPKLCSAQKQNDLCFTWPKNAGIT